MFHPSISDVAIELAGRTVHHLNRNKDSGKSRGGGVYIYINNSWCTDSRTLDSHCSPEMEYLTIRCRPLYLPHEFSAVVITAVYIPSGTNSNANAKANAALSHLYSICNHQKQYPEAVHIIGYNTSYLEQNGGEAAVVLLRELHQDRPELLHLNVVHQLHCRREVYTPKGRVFFSLWRSFTGPVASERPAAS